MHEHRLRIVLQCVGLRSGLYLIAKADTVEL